MSDWNDAKNQSHVDGDPVGQGFFLNDFEADMPHFDHPLCAEVDGELFYPETGGTVRYAKSICRDCTVQVECLEWALTHGERFGVWGGTTPQERRKIIAARGLKPKPVPKERKQVVYTEEGRAARVAQLNRARVAKHRRNKAA